MGGGNGLKSHMAQAKNQAKKAQESKGGGGAAGKEARTIPKDGFCCALCKAPFTSVKMMSSLVSHHQAKHSKNTFSECFPGVEK